jgi:hypothetical protein
MKKDPNAEALKHALAALDDGSGHECWGPGPIGGRLWKNGHHRAAEAFDMAAICASRLGHLQRPRMIATIRAVAPVLLEAMGEDEVEPPPPPVSSSFNVSDETLDEMVAKGLMIKTGTKQYLVPPAHDERSVHTQQVAAMNATTSQFMRMAMLSNHDD